jgi:flagellar biosynthesis/type III secretory pathway protein FliH
MHTERVTYLSTADQKAALEAFAKARGESVGNVVREATAHFIGKPTETEEAELAALVEQVNEAVPKMQASIDRINARLESMARKNEEFLKQMGIAV